MKAPLQLEIARALSERFGTPVQVLGTRVLGGGCINQASRVETTEGVFFAKSHSQTDARFSTEARQLEALRRSNTSLSIAEPIAWKDALPSEEGYLVCRFLEAGTRGQYFYEELGLGLAELHRATAPRFGFEIDTPCGDTWQPNAWRTSWLEFYRDARLGFQLELLARKGQLSGSDRQRFRKLLDRLDTWLPDEGPPALIHGDLWSGNLMVGPRGEPALIDPAVYYGHREAELGMMSLFGGFSAEVYDAYQAAWPLAPGWRERLPLYELWHLANHATLFGGSYVDSTMRIVRTYVG